MKTIFLALSLLITSAFSLEAKDITINEFLLTAANDTLLEYEKEKIDFLSSSSSNTPFLDRVELRTQTEESDLNKQSYSVRFYPKGFGSTSAGKEVHAATIESAELQHGLSLHQALKTRYLLIVALLHTQKELSLIRRLSDVLKDKVMVLEKLGNDRSFDINELISAGDKFTKTQLEIIELESNAEQIKNTIQTGFPVESRIAFADVTLTGIDMIRDLTQDLITVSVTENIYFKNSSLDIKLAQSRYNLEKAENRKVVSFLEASYDDKERRNTDAFFFEIGIRLPFINSNRLDINRRKVRLLTAQERKSRLEQELKQNIETCSANITMLLKQHDVLSDKKKQASTELSIKAYAQIEGADPLALLKMKESIIKRDLSAVKISRGLFTNYIELLDVSGRLSHKPLKNYLSKNQELLLP
jgi:hypothetical protein